MALPKIWWQDMTTNILICFLEGYNMHHTSSNEQQKSLGWWKRRSRIQCDIHMQRLFSRDSINRSLLFLNNIVTPLILVWRSLWILRRNHIRKARKNRRRKMEAATTPTTIGTYLCVPPTAHKWETIITPHAWFPNVTTSTSAWT